jgi:DNA repair protein RadC
MPFRSGQRLLHDVKDLSGLHRAPFDEHCQQNGIGEAKAAQIKAAIELGRRMAHETPLDRGTITSPADAAALVAYEMSALEQEHLRVILLDIRNHVLDIVEVYKGLVSSSQVHVGELFMHAIRRNALSMIVVQNHPSGDPSPSSDDVAVTRAIIQAGKLLTLDVLDHMVIGLGRWVSMKECGLGFA